MQVRAISRACLSLDSKHISIRTLDNLLNYFWQTLFRMLPGKENKASPRKVLPWFPQFCNLDHCKKNLLCSNHQCKKTRQETSLFISTFIVVAESDLPEVNHLILLL